MDQQQKEERPKLLHRCDLLHNPTHFICDARQVSKSCFGTVCVCVCVDMEATTTKSDFHFPALWCGELIFFFFSGVCRWSRQRRPGEQSLYSTSLSSFSSCKRKETHAARLLKARMLMCKNTECISAVKRHSYSKGCYKHIVQDIY